MSRVALAVIVFFCLIPAFCGPAKKVPLFRQRMAAKVRVDLSLLESLVARDRVLQGGYEAEMEAANRAYEGLSLSNNLEAVVALTNNLPKVRAELEKFRRDSFGFGELYLLTDAAWERARGLVLPQDLIEAIRIRKETTACRLVMLAGLEMLASERGNAYRLSAVRVVADIDGRLKPNCRKNGLQESSKSWQGAAQEERLGRELVEAGYWEDGEKVLRHAAELYENAIDEAILSGLDG